VLLLLSLALREGLCHHLLLFQILMHVSDLVCEHGLHAPPFLRLAAEVSE
jgi:hypothetical protein